MVFWSFLKLSAANIRSCIFIALQDAIWTKDNFQVVRDACGIFRLIQISVIRINSSTVSILTLGTMDNAKLW